MLNANDNIRNIAESLLHFCGVSETRLEPYTGHVVFTVDKIPEDIPQVGIHWIEVRYRTFNIKSLFEEDD
jgi:hypothetical protein